MKLKIDDFLESHLNERLDFPALYFFKNHTVHSFTNGELLKKCHQLKSQLQKAGLKPGDRIIFVGENSANWIVAYIATLLAHGIIVPADSEIMHEDLHKLIQQIVPSLIFCSEAQAFKCHSEVPQIILDHLPQILEENELSFNLKESSEESLREVVTMVQSSGTGGETKSIQLTHDNLIDVISTYQKKLLSNYASGYILNLLPLSAIYPTVICLACLCYGIPFFIANPKQENVFDIISKEQIYSLPAVPMLLELIHKKIFASIKQQSPYKQVLFRSLLSLAKILRRWGFNLGKKVFKSIHSTLKVERFLTGGAPLAINVSKDLYGLGFTIQEGYGLTETCGLVSNTDGHYENLGTAGEIVEGMEVQIVPLDESGVGEILIRGRLMAGYYKNPELTKQILHNGVLHTGDLGRFDKRGNLIIVGRLKDIIVHGDERKTSPEEIEKHYKDIEGIKKLAVIGIPDELGSYDKVHAVVTLEEAFLSKYNDDPTIALGIIKKEINQKGSILPDHLKIPYVHLVSHIPVNNLGKTKRAELKKMLNVEICSSQNFL